MERDGARWSEDSVQAMPTEDIFSQLRALGIESSVESFRALAASYDSSERLFEGTWGTLWEEDTDDALFAWIAMDVLWERILPDRVRIEDVDRRVVEGYGLKERNESEAALEKWWEAWEKTKAWLADKPARTFDDIQELAGDGLTDYFLNWTWDFNIALSNAMKGNRVWAERRLEIFDDLGSRLVDENRSNTVNFALACAESLFALRRKKEGDVRFAALIERFPDELWGYIGWADEYI